MFVLLNLYIFLKILTLFHMKIIQVFLDMEQNRKIYQNLVLSPGYVAVIFKRLKSASTLLLVSSITYALYCLYFLNMFQCPISVSLFILLTVCDLFSNKIRNTKSSLFSIQLLDTLYKNVKLVLQRFKYLLYFNSKFSLNLNESSFFSYS